MKRLTTYYRVFFKLPWNDDEHYWDTGVDYEAAQFARLVKATRVELRTEIETSEMRAEPFDISKVKA